MTNERTHYRERSPWPGWVGVLIWAVVVLVCYPLLAGWDVDLPFALRAAIAAAVVGVTALIRAVLGGMTTLVQESRLFLHMGFVPLVRKVVPYTEIVAMRPVTYRPIVEFGGWGVRGFGKKRAWTARGNRALVLELDGGGELYVGSDHPQRLEERIRTVSGDRLGRARLVEAGAEPGGVGGHARGRRPDDPDDSLDAGPEARR